MKRLISLTILILVFTSCNTNNTHVTNIPLLASSIMQLNGPAEIKCSVTTATNVKDLVLKNWFPNYWLWILGIILCIRATITFFKIFAIQQGEADFIEESTEDGKVKKEKIIHKDLSLKEAFCKTFIGFNRDYKYKTIDDHWLPALLGATELYIYPILIVAQEWKIIAFWLGMKTAGGWGTWQKTRASYSRFLFGNLLVLAFSFWLIQFVKT